MDNDGNDEDGDDSFKKFFQNWINDLPNGFSLLPRFVDSPKTEEILLIQSISHHRSQNLEQQQHWQDADQSLMQDSLAFEQEGLEHLERHPPKFSEVKPLRKIISGKWIWHNRNFGRINGSATCAEDTAKLWYCLCLCGSRNVNS